MRRSTILILSCLFLCLTISLPAQPEFYSSYTFTSADTIRGRLSPERACYDVTFYELDIRVDPGNRLLSGFVDIHFQVAEDFDRMQIDLFDNMNILSISSEGEALDYRRFFNAVFVELPRTLHRGETGLIRVRYQGEPLASHQPPWQGGFVWKTDAAGKPWVGVACEGDGASLWWPCKDHLSDEPDSMSIRVAVPDSLVCVSNGNLLSVKAAPGGYRQWNWFVQYPINNYNVTVNIADYVHFSDWYVAGDGDTLSLDYYVLRDHEDKARVHFRQVPRTLACFERYLGKYPFWKDGYALVETPYFGMEHQSAIAYGNNYRRGYMGGMIPADMNWDYIIVHETAHEWWGNSVSCTDHAEMWIHESFATYMEALFVECAYSYADAVRYLQGQRIFRNQEPMLGPPDVNWDSWKAADHYYKGAWMLHTLRHVINDDALWFDLFRSIYERFAGSSVTTADIVGYINQCTKMDFSPFFEQYLVYPGLPTLEYQLRQLGPDVEMNCRWVADVEGFAYPVLLGSGERVRQVQPGNDWRTFRFKGARVADCRPNKELFLANFREVKRGEK